MTQLLELGNTALIDVRGERIVELMRQRLTKQFGVTVIGQNVTVRFNHEGSLKQVSMLVTSVTDSEINDPNFDDETPQ